MLCNTVKGHGDERRIRIGLWETRVWTPRVRGTKGDQDTVTSSLKNEI